MTRFNPTTRTIQPDDGPDLLAGAVLDSLTRPMRPVLSMNLISSLILTVLTLGVVPLIGMVMRLRAFVAIQQQQLWHLAEWLRLQTGDADADSLQRASQKIRYSTPTALLTWLFVLIAAGACAMHFTSRPFAVRELFRLAYHLPATPETIIFAFSISAAAVCNWIHLARHQQNVASYLRWFNHLVARQNLDEVPLPKLELGLSPAWLAAGIVLAASGALWGLPVMLAAGAHRRYISVGSVQVRALLADRLRALLRGRRPAMRLPPPLAAARVCVRPNCRSPLPPAASFCPRCGTRALKTMDVVA